MSGLASGSFSLSLSSIITLTGEHFFLGSPGPLFGRLGAGGFQEIGSGASLGSLVKYCLMLILPWSLRNQPLAPLTKFFGRHATRSRGVSNYASKFFQVTHN